MNNPLFKSADGIDIYTGSEYWYVDYDQCLYQGIADHRMKDKDGERFFSSKQLAENFRNKEENKMSNNNPAEYPGKAYQPLFDLFFKEHGIILCESEMADIIQVVNNIQQGKLPAEVQQNIEQQANEAYGRMKENAEGEKDIAYAQGYAEGWHEGATAWAIWKQRHDELKKKLADNELDAYEAQGQFESQEMAAIRQNEAFIRLQERYDKLKSKSGAVWVKASERLPDRYKAKFVRIEGVMSIAAWHYIHERFVDDAGDFHPADQVEWLDESGATDWKAKHDHEIALLKEVNNEALNLTEKAQGEYAALKEELREKTNSVKSLRYGLDNREAECKALKEKADKMEAALKGIEQMSDPGDYWLAITRMKSIASEALAWKGEKEVGNG